MKTFKPVLLTLALAALAAFMFTAAPVQQASATEVMPSGYSDPCYYYHYSDDPDFQMWNEFCEDTVRELANRHRVGSCRPS